MPPMIAPDGKFVGRGSHEVFGEAYLRDLGFSDKVCGLVGSHVWAKRYLTGTEKEYYDGLSESSKTTLKYQVGPRITERGLLLCSRAVRLRKSKFKRLERILYCSRSSLYDDGTTRQRCLESQCRISPRTEAWQSSL